eukprot:14272-Heterococcus_DN1.PRE.1
MSAGLSAFFGVALGGALFALEVCHTMGYQFYEIAVHSVGGVQGASFGAIWAFPAAPACDVNDTAAGATITAADARTTITTVHAARSTAAAISCLS